MPLEGIVVKIDLKYALLLHGSLRRRAPLLYLFGQQLAEQLEEGCGVAAPGKKSMRFSPYAFKKGMAVSAFNGRSLFFWGTIFFATVGLGVSTTV